MQREVALKSMEHFIYLILPSRDFNLFFIQYINLHWYRNKTQLKSIIPRHLCSSLDTNIITQNLTSAIQDWIISSDEFE